MSFLAALTVIGLAYWAYQENFRTQQSLAEVRDLQQEIAEARVQLNTLRAEWAYLNRPDRLADLAELNFDRLGLMPIRPRQFGLIEEVRYRRIDPAEIHGPVDVSAAGQSGDGAGGGTPTLSGDPAHPAGEQDATAAGTPSAETGSAGAARAGAGAAGADTLGAVTEGAVTEGADGEAIP